MGGFGEEQGIDVNLLYHYPRCPKRRPCVVATERAIWRNFWKNENKKDINIVFDMPTIRGAIYLKGCIVLCIAESRDEEDFQTVMLAARRLTPKISNFSSLLYGKYYAFVVWEV